ncbi:MAG: twin-arginine translocation signal domain-containing protein [Deltaproteobacteria bacterium]|nr:twin-arginine translocation signal domain-containing protein [Deltaproteobacteria bacterium]
MDRRDFLKLAGIGGAVFASGLSGCATAVNGPGGAVAQSEDFFFLQLSDTHWGFTGPAANPDDAVTLKKTVETINSLDVAPDFIVFTGDLTHTTDDGKERRSRLDGFRDIVGKLKVNTRRFMPGEHDASLDRGEAYQEFFGAPNYTFDHKGVHFIVLDNVSDPAGAIGDKQLEWLGNDLKRLDKDARIVVLTHRPLFDLYPQWDWATRDGAKAVSLLLPYRNVTVFYGHIHHEHHFMTAHIPHHSAKSLIFALPAPGSVPKRVPVLWNDGTPYKGLGFRQVTARTKSLDCAISELSVVKG